MAEERIFQSLKIKMKYRQECENTNGIHKITEGNRMESIGWGQ